MFVFKKYKKYLVAASMISLLSFSSANAVVNVATEAELRAALTNVAAESDINITADITLTSDLTLPSGTAFTITGNENNLTAGDFSLTIPNDAAITNLLVDNNTNYRNLSTRAIYNDNVVYTISNAATFINNTNTGDHGGAIYNTKDFTIDGDAIFSDNSNAGGSYKGGAIYHTSDTFTINGNATFTGNVSQYNGGAIFSKTGEFLIDGNANFTNNNVNFGSGGAIYLELNDFIINGSANFTNNRAENGGNSGGAVFVHYYSNFIAKDGATFINNLSESNGVNGGAICAINYSTSTLIANTNNVEFTGNTSGGNDNAILLYNNSTLNLNASNNANVIFNDKIASSGTGNVININATGTWDDVSSPTVPTGNKIPVSAPTTGEIILNQDMTGLLTADTVVNLYGGKITLGTDGVFFNTGIFNAYSGSTLNLMNNEIDTVVFGTANIDNMNLNIDVDLGALTADTVNATILGANNDITLSEITVIDETQTEGTVEVDPDDEFNITLGSGANTASGAVYNYDVENNGDGTISLTKTVVNPVVQATSVTQQNACANIAITNTISLGRADEVMSLIDSIQTETGVDYDMVNKVAALEGSAKYSTLYGRLEKGSAWFRPFSNLEKINIKNMNDDVDSTSYGMIIGYDSSLKRMKRGFKGLMSAYGGYNGASQKYEGVDLYQNGGFFGVMGALYKDNFYTSLSTNVGGTGVVENLKGYGSSNYGMFTTSVASKSGYNFHLPKNIRMQLNGQIAYSMVSPQDYTNAQGAAIESDVLHVIQMVPGIKITKAIGDWHPYLSTNMIFNPLNDSKVKANEVVLPDTSLGCYVEYGLGIQKQNENETSGFLQATVRNGSRTGVNLQFGFKMPVGAEEAL